jgi:hypothetical protein
MLMIFPLGQLNGEKQSLIRDRYRPERRGTGFFSPFRHAGNSAGRLLVCGELGHSSLS